MKVTVTESVFLNAFRDSGRWGQFSHNALCALFEYFDELDNEWGEDSELDPVAICCDWSEYDSATEWARDYYTDEQFRAETEGMDDEEQEEHFIETLRNETQVLELSDGSVVVQAF